ncbi:MAG TPA: sigma-54 dependent transcriptional regulator, partial [Syntrophales bacterium]|nr:sigma-54 dependent transcriptional regulator [Syntrophales bacterium]
MQRSRFQISLYVLIPIIFSGITVFAVIVTYQIVDFYTKYQIETPWMLRTWGIGIALFTFLCALLVTWLILRPIKKFIRDAENLPAFPKSQIQSAVDQKADDISQFNIIFEQVTSLLSKVEARELFPEIIGQSKVMRGIFSQILKVAPTDATVLITGESGTGKELVAQSIYQHSLRKDGPFIKLNCVAIPEGLLESELFGHEKGSFTGATAQKRGKFELAHGGTILLDEIGDMPLATQAKLLRVLQEKEFERVGGTKPIRVDIRIIASTNKNLMKLVQEGKFREDLFYRLNVFSLHLPPLRDRREDIPALAQGFLETAPKSAEISSSALQLLMGFQWPGNVRELKNVIERAAVMAENGVIEPQHLPAQISGGIVGQAMQEVPEQANLDDRLAEIEKRFIIDALTRADGVQVRAAQILGIKERSLWHRVKKYN